MEVGGKNGAKDMNLQDRHYTVVGLGMEGGSYAIALRDCIAPKKIYGIDIDEKTLEAAYDMGVIEKGKTEEILQDTDVLILAIYSGAVCDFLREYQQYLPPHAIISDLCGTKQLLVPEILSFLRKDLSFIPGHPMAGNEHRGFLYADKKIFEGCNYIFTPVEGTREEDLDFMTRLAYGIGSSTVTTTDIVTHDKKMAYASQLTHLLSVCLTNSPSFDNELTKFIGGSFRDLTRVANINPDLWTDAFFQCKEDLLEEIEKFETNLTNCKEALKRDDRKAIYGFLEESRRRKRV